MYQKQNFLKTAIRRLNPRKRVKFLTVRANWSFVSSHSRAARPTALLPIGIEAVRFGLSICGSPAGQWCGGRCVRTGYCSGCGCSCVRSCSDRGDGVAVGGCALGVVLGVFAHGVELLRSGRGCGGSVWRVCSQLRSCKDCELCARHIKA